MNLNKSLLLPAVAFTITVAAIVSLGYPNISQAFDENATAADATAQAPLEGPENATDSRVEQRYMSTGRAVYMLENPAIQFAYDPNFFVLESFETAQSAPETPSVNSIYLWSRKDYLSLKNAGDELGDFLSSLRLSVYENPEGLPLEDWITTQASSIFVSEIKNVRKAEVTVANQEAWTFSYRSLFEYDNIAFKDADGRVIVLRFGLPVRDSSASLEAIESDQAYSTALSVMIESMELTAAPN